MNVETAKTKWSDFRDRIDWSTAFNVAVPGIVAFLIGLGLEYTKAQAFTFSASCSLFSIWLIDRGGGEVGWFTESLRFQILVSLGFVVIYWFSHFEIAHDGTIYCRPVTALMVALIFLPYAVTVALELMLGD